MTTMFAILIASWIITGLAVLTIIIWAIRDIFTFRAHQRKLNGSRDPQR